MTLDLLQMPAGPPLRAATGSALADVAIAVWSLHELKKANTDYPDQNSR